MVKSPAHEAEGVVVGQQKVVLDATGVATPTNKCTRGHACMVVHSMADKTVAAGAQCMYSTSCLHATPHRVLHTSPYHAGCHTLAVLGRDGSRSKAINLGSTPRDLMEQQKGSDQLVHYPPDRSAK
jgi:hypothetical protein